MLGPFTRRRVLVALGGLGVFVAAGLRACVPSLATTKPDELRTLTADEYRLFSKLVPLVLPTAGSRLTPTDEIPVLKNLDEAFGGIDPKLRDDLGKGLMLFDLGAVVLGGSLTRFVNLDETAALAYCEKWQSGSSVQRAIFNAIKQFVCVSYWRDPRTWGPVEYDGPVSDKNNLPRLGNAPMPEET